MCWVRPGFLDAKASCFCCVNVLMQVDLPAFERPTNAISGTSSGGKKWSSGAVVKNLAVCNHPKATVVWLFPSLPEDGPAWEFDVVLVLVVIDKGKRP